MEKIWIAPIAAGIGAGVAASVLFGNRGMNLRGATVLITGGSRGLGIALVREFAAEGCRLAISARDADELRAAREDLEERGAEVFDVTCDVRDREQVEWMAELVHQRCPTCCPIRAPSSRLSAFRKVFARS